RCARSAAWLDDYGLTNALNLEPAHLSTDPAHLKHPLVATSRPADGFAALPDDPPLSIIRAPGAFIVSWPTSATNWVLVQSPRLERPVPWSTVASDLYQSNVTQRYVVFSPVETNRFYRLRNPGSLVPAFTGEWGLDEGEG